MPAPAGAVYCSTLYKLVEKYVRLKSVFCTSCNSPGKHMCLVGCGVCSPEIAAVNWAIHQTLVRSPSGCLARPPLRLSVLRVLTRLIFPRDGSTGQNNADAVRQYRADVLERMASEFAVMWESEEEVRRCRSRRENVQVPMVKNISLRSNNTRNNNVRTPSLVDINSTLKCPNLCDFTKRSPTNIDAALKQLFAQYVIHRSSLPRCLGKISHNNIVHRRLAK